MRTAHIFLHFAIGMGVGTLLALKPLVERCYLRRPLVPAFWRWFVLSYGLGGWAIMPSLLRQLGLPPAFCSGWWMNLFLLHPLIGRLHPGGMLINQVGMATLATLQYAALVVAVVAAGRRQ